MPNTVLDLDIVLTASACKLPEPPEGIETGDLIVSLPKSVIDAGALLGALAPVPVGTGDLIPSNPLPGAPYPLNHARIGYITYVPGSAITATEDPVGSNSLHSASTWERWRPTADTVLSVEFLEPRLIDYIGIAAHTLGSNGVTVDITSSPDLVAAFTPLVSSSPTTDNALLLVVPETTVQRLSFTFTGAVSGFEMAVLYAGLLLQMIRPIYGGHSPITLSAQNTYLPNKSDRGQFLGRDIIRQGYGTTASFKNIPAAWYRDHFQPFVEHAKTRPYFWAWNLAEFPGEVAYCWNNQDISPGNSGTRDLMTVSWSMEGHK